MADFTYHVFISYSHLDGDWVKNWLLPRLEGAGLSVCMDLPDHGFPIGGHIITNMVNAVKQSRKILLVMTPNWVKSEWSEFESLLVEPEDLTGTRKRIIGLMVEKCQPSKHISNLNYLDFTNPANREDNFKHVIAAIRESPTPQPPCSSVELTRLPSCDRIFVGRQKQFDDITRALESCGIAAIWGIPGSGKTQLALKVANSLLGKYPRTQFINMRGTDDKPRTATDALKTCIRELTGTSIFEPAGQNRKLPEDEDELKAWYDAILRDNPTLILLDDVADQKQIDSLIPPKGCPLLVTSIKDLAIAGTECPIHLGELELEEGRELMRKIARRVPDDVADRISILCDLLPLAILTAATYLQQTINVEPAEFEEHLERERRLLLGGTPGVPLSVEAAFNLSYKTLKPKTQEVFRKLAVFPSSFDASAEAEVCEDPGYIGSTHLSELVRYSMVNYCGETKRYYLQNLLHLFAGQLLTEEERKHAAARHAKYYEGVLSSACELYLKGGESILQGLALFDRERNNFRIGWQWAQSHCEADGEAARLCMRYPVTGDLLFELRDHPKDRIAMFEATLSCARRLNERQIECRLLSGLGNAYYDAGDTQQAIQSHNQQSALAHELGNKIEECNSLNNLGKDYLSSDKSRALELHQQALRLCEETGDEREKGRALNHLANAYLGSGDFPSARKHYEKQLEIARKIGDRRREGRALNGIGNCYFSTGSFRKAINYHEQRLKIAREIGHRSGECSSLTNMGSAYLNLGDAEKAKKLHSESLKIAREIGEQYGEMIAVSNLGEAHAALGETRRAIELYDQALALCRQINSLYDECYVLSDLGAAHAGVGETRRAIKFYEKALSISRSPQSNDPHAEAHALNGLGEARSALGDTESAIGLYNQALALFRESKIRDRMGEGIVLNNLGKAYRELGDPRRAVEFHTQALNIAIEVKDRRGQGLAQNNLGRDHIDLGDLDSADRYLEEALNIAREIHNSRGEGNALFNMSLALDKRGDRAGAIAQAEVALKIYERVEHPNAARVREQLARWRNQQQHN